MPPAKDSLDKFLRQFRRIILVCIKGHHVGQFIGNTLYEIHPVDPGLPADISRYEILPVPVPRHTRHTGQAGRIPVLFINRHTVLLQEVIQESHPFPVFLIVLRIHTDDSMKAFAPAVNQRGNRQFQLTEHGILLSDGQRVRFHQGKPESCYVVIFHAVPVQRIEANPCAGIRFPVPDRGAQVVGMFFQRCDEFPGRAVIDPFARYPFIIGILPDIIRHITDPFFRVE